MENFGSIIDRIGEIPALGQWLIGGFFVALALLVAWAGVNALLVPLRRLAVSSQSPISEILVDYIRRPLRLIFPAIVLRTGTSYLALPEGVGGRLDHALTAGLILGVGYGSTRVVMAVRDYVLKNQNIASEDNLRARRATTQIRVLGRILVIVVWAIAFSAMLMTFSKIRELGISLLASAGITGIIIGFAAQKTLGNLLAGIQIAFTQPIRIDDVVVVEGEWGRIEEITLTFVVVRIWDLRRLVLPINYFIEKPFQNWTRVSADILAPVYIYTDYTLPPEEIRKETKRIAEATELWDRKVCVVQVTDCKPHVMEVRLLVSAKDSPTAWNLRCHIREEILRFIQREYPSSLPHVRATLTQSSFYVEDAKEHDVTESSADGMPRKPHGHSRLVHGERERE
ncbi:MAG: mechanosensitive ion channel [Chitinivibrionales bacterium]|nr:mechanosensitive ion channel [Chitinivibrionales bacterium]MBD3357688.1 mechanosensitive ion channel [Chitinivibrionales bacterium]